MLGAPWVEALAASMVLILPALPAHVLCGAYAQDPVGAPKDREAQEYSRDMIRRYRLAHFIPTTHSYYLW